uniref:Angiopoietin-like 1b n=1 Tax=Labrus bergylta TaxID=56723 RepID=A0A3Q3F5Q1_9LABR
MGPGAWSLFILFGLSLWSQALTKHPILSRIRRAPEANEENKKCSYTFLVPEQKITGPICAARGYSVDKDRVTRVDVAGVRDLLSKQRREMETLKLVVDVDGNMVNEMKLLRKESRNMNSRVTQLYMQLLHEIIRKRDNSLELAQLETRILNATTESLRLASRYRELEAKYAALSAVVNNQSVLIGALEERCMQVYSRRHEQSPMGPPMVQVVPENIPVNGSRSGPSPTGGTLEVQKPLQRNFSTEGELSDAQEAGQSTSGMYLIKPDEAERPLQVWCEQDIDNGGWTVIQSRRDGSVNFFRNWENYKVMTLSFKTDTVNCFGNRCQRTFPTRIMKQHWV